MQRLTAARNNEVCKENEDEDSEEDVDMDQSEGQSFLAALGLRPPGNNDVTKSLRAQLEELDEGDDEDEYHHDERRHHDNDDDDDNDSGGGLKVRRLELIDSLFTICRKLRIRARS